MPRHKSVFVFARRDAHFAAVAREVRIGKSGRTPRKHKVMQV
jgi:hypothetical protein